VGQKQEEAQLILRLYEMRRDQEMRKAREWFDVAFSPQSAEEILTLMKGSFEVTTYFRMVLSYWEMVAGLVNYGAIDAGLLHSTNVEHLRVFGKMEPYLSEVRAAVGDDFLAETEKLAASAPNSEKLLAGARAVNQNWHDKREKEGGK
jgi:hypothetical protein